MFNPGGPMMPGAQFNFQPGGPMGRPNPMFQRMPSPGGGGFNPGGPQGVGEALQHPPQQHYFPQGNAWGGATTKQQILSDLGRADPRQINNLLLGGLPHGFHGAFAGINPQMLKQLGEMILNGQVHNPYANQMPGAPHPGGGGAPQLGGTALPGWLTDTARPGGRMLPR